ncbi:hypothetical protein HK098_006553 [Nowakowskiella sp. JEL0407]|nr:hypothetical protein HK098_006553 [Nowakowskiella sp. JEL0407]
MQRLEKLVNLNSPHNLKLTNLTSEILLNLNPPEYALTILLYNALSIAGILIFVITLTLLYVLYIYITLPPDTTLKRTLLMKLLLSAPSPQPQTLHSHPFRTRVLPHGNLVRVAENLWQVKGSLPEKGPQLPRVMTIYKIPETGGLWLHSVMCLREEVMEELDALGDVEYIVVPCRNHTLDAVAYKNRYPTALVVCPEISREIVEEQVIADTTCEEAFSEYDPKSNLSIQYMVPRGYMSETDHMGELVYVLRLTDEVKQTRSKKQYYSALIFCDLFFNVSFDDADSMAIYFGSWGFFGTTSVGRILIKNEKEFTEFVTRDLEEVVVKRNVIVMSVAHGDWVIGGRVCLEKIREAGNRLMF